ncbi:DUF6673 family protein [Clostridium gasigenes]|uniref:DUF6673 family protein n=1 Tax=Clostridium gasigenes TaxID=94869 RepID=UPI001C0AC01D|nr:DUF6673 family protein [Clostridium gasigenes]MBU3107139.1 AP endonuclease [Clostridium gasigenes]
MKINNIELENIDIFDADTAEKYENVLDKVVNYSKKLEGLKTSSVIRSQCEAVFEVFNELFGEGTDKKVFGEKVNLKICLSSFAELVEQINSQKGEVDKIVSKYSPNRANRRTKK